MRSPREPPPDRNRARAGSDARRHVDGEHPAARSTRRRRRPEHADLLVPRPSHGQPPGIRDRSAQAARAGHFRRRERDRVPDSDDGATHPRAQQIRLPDRHRRQPGDHDVRSLAAGVVLNRVLRSLAEGHRPQGQGRRAGDPHSERAGREEGLRDEGLDVDRQPTSEGSDGDRLPGRRPHRLPGRVSGRNRRRDHRRRHDPARLPAPGPACDLHPP